MKSLHKVIKCVFRYEIGVSLKNSGFSYLYGSILLGYEKNRCFSLMDFRDSTSSKNSWCSFPPYYPIVSLQVLGLSSFGDEFPSDCAKSSHFHLIICDLQDITPKFVWMSTNKITRGHLPRIQHSIMLLLLNTLFECLFVFVADPCRWSAVPFAPTACTFKDILPQVNSCPRVVVDDNGVVPFGEFLCTDCQCCGAFLLDSDS